MADVTIVETVNNVTVNNGVVAVTTSTVTNDIHLGIGPQGPAGAPAGSSNDYTFAHGDAPQVCYTAPNNLRLTEIVLTIRTAFDGSAPTIQIGKVGTGSPPHDILAIGDCDPATAATYIVELDYPLNTGEQLFLTISPNGSTQGNGVFNFSTAA